MNVHQEPPSRQILLELFDDVVELIVDLFRAGVAHRGLHNVPVGIALGPVIIRINDLYITDYYQYSEDHKLLMYHK